MLQTSRQIFSALSSAQKDPWMKILHDRYIRVIHPIVKMISKLYGMSSVPLGSKKKAFKKGGE